MKFDRMRSWQNSREKMSSVTIDVSEQDYEWKSGHTLAVARERIEIGSCVSPSSDEVETVPSMES